MSGKKVLTPAIASAAEAFKEHPEWCSPEVMGITRGLIETRGVECPDCEGTGSRKYAAAVFLGVQCFSCAGSGRQGDFLDPERLLILSDALEETGCDDWWVLYTLRSAGEFSEFILNMILWKP